MKIRSWFWPLQLLVWFVIGGVNFCAQYFFGRLDLTLAVLNFTGLSVGGLISSTLYRYYFRGVKLKIRWKGIIFHVLASSLFQSLLWMLIMLLLSWPFAKTYSINFVRGLLNLVPIYIIILAWDLIYLGYHLILTYHQNEVERWKLESEFQKAQLGALKSQVNPHFMFNAINNIRALILENPVLARDMLTKFAEIFRHALQYTNEKLITIGEELHILTHYLEIHKLHFEERLTYCINLQENLQNQMIPPMVLQLLVENSIKHGIGLSEEGGEIFIDIYKQQTNLILQVKNTGKLSSGTNLEGSLGIGLQNIKERLLLTYGNHAKLDIAEESSFVVVTISIDR